MDSWNQKHLGRQSSCKCGPMPSAERSHLDLELDLSTPWLCFYLYQPHLRQLSPYSDKKNLLTAVNYIPLGSINFLIVLEKVPELKTLLSILGLMSNYGTRVQFSLIQITFEWVQFSKGKLNCFDQNQDESKCSQRQ